MLYLLNRIITLNGTNYSKIPNLEDFTNLDNRWFEMDALIEDKVFLLKITSYYK
jgi:hypothetical protein